MAFLSDNGEPYIFRQNVCNNEFIYRKKNVDHCYPDTSSSIRSHSILQLKHCDNNEIKVFGRYTSSLEDNDAHIQPFIMHTFNHLLCTATFTGIQERVSEKVYKAEGQGHWGSLTLT